MDTQETIIDTAPKLEIHTGPLPATCNAAPTGVVLATIHLPSDWLATAIQVDALLLGAQPPPPLDIPFKMTFFVPGLP
jgi:hypothetical protein